MENRIELPKKYDEFVQLLKDNRNNPEKLDLIIDSAFEDFYRNYDSPNSVGRIASTVVQAYSEFVETPDKKPVKNARCVTIVSPVLQALNDAGIPAAGFETAALVNSDLLGKLKEGTSHMLLIYKKGDNSYVIKDPRGEKVQVSAGSMVEAAEKGVAQLPRAFSSGIIELSDEKGEKIAYTKFALGEMVPLENNPDPNSPLKLRSPFEMSDSVKANSGGKPFSLKMGAYANKKYGKAEGFGVYETTSANVNVGMQHDFKKGSSLALDINGSYSDINTYDYNEAKSQEVDYKVFSGTQRLMLQTPELLREGNDKKSARGFVMEEFGIYGVSAKAKARTKEGETLYGQTLNEDAHLSLVGGMNSEKTNEDKTIVADTKIYTGIRMDYAENLLRPHVLKRPTFSVVSGAEESLEFDLPAPGASMKLTASASGVKSEDYMLLGGYSSAEARVKRGNTEACGYGGIGATSTMLRGDKEPYVEVVPFAGAGVRQDISKKVRIDTGVSKTGLGIANGWNVGGGLTVGF